MARCIFPGSVSTVAGSLGEGSRDGRGRNAQFRFPMGIDFSKDGDILVADQSNHCIRRVLLGGDYPVHVETFVGISGQAGYKDGKASRALFNRPFSVAVSSDGTVYVADAGNYRIRKIAVVGPTIVTSLAGSGESKLTDGMGLLASFVFPRDIICAKNNDTGGFYVSDANSIRHVTNDGTVSTLTGKLNNSGHQDGDGRRAKFCDPHQLACTSSGIIYVADGGNNAIRVVNADTRIVRTIAGGNDPGFKDGEIDISRFYCPVGIAVGYDGQIFVADTSNHRIRRISSSASVQEVSTVAGNKNVGLFDSHQTVSHLKSPRYLLLDRSTNTLYFTQDHCLRKICLPNTSLPQPELVRNGSLSRKPLLQLEPSLLKDVLSLADNQHLSDVVFKVQEKSIYASKNLLRLRSQYFDRMFSSGMKESVQTSAPITAVSIQDVDYESFKALIVYLMTDKLTVDPNDYKMVRQLLVVSDQFMVDRLKLHCERLLERHIQEDNVFELVHWAVSYGAESVKVATLRYIIQHREVRQRPEMLQLPHEFLADVMKSL